MYSFVKKREFKRDISRFCCFINLPISTSTTIIKRILFNLIINNDKLNHKLLHKTCKSLHLNWSTEVRLLRNYLLEWYNDNKNVFINYYFPINSTSSIHIIEKLFLAYSKNIHCTFEYFDLCNVMDICDENEILDKKLMRNQA